jgi:2'-5' RNA ligase
MPGLRLFVALDLPDGVKQALAALRTDISAASWSNAANLHLTLKFLGDGIDEGRLPNIVAALRAVHGPALSLALHGVGRFPPNEGRSPAVLWAGLDAPPALGALARAVDEALVPLGFPAEDRPFAPHLTLARLKSPDGAAAVERFLTTHAALTSPPFTAPAFHLYASHLSAQGATYRQLASFPLDAPSA